jgi:hypothetical protein
MADDNMDLEKFLRLEAKDYTQEQEVERILKLVKMGNKDPLLTLDMPTDFYVTLQIDNKVLRKQFRTKSLLVHPGMTCRF